MKTCLAVLLLLPAQRSGAQTIANSDRKFGGSALNRPASFPGDSLLQFLQHNLHLPETSSGGRVVVQFSVSASGWLSGFSLLRSSGDPALDSEALRICRLMPPYKPALIDGNPAGSTVQFPFRFE